MIWRLIYTNTEVIDLLETNGITATPHQIFESTTQEECFDKIDELKFDFEYTLDEINYVVFKNGIRSTEIRSNNKQ
jgi:hypothetical protein